MTIALLACKTSDQEGRAVLQTVFRDEEEDLYFGVDIANWLPNTEAELTDGPPQNPQYRSDLNLNLTHSNMSRLAAALGIQMVEGEFLLPADEFLERAAKWLDQHQGTPSAAIPTKETQAPSGMKIIHLGRPSGWLNETVAIAANIAKVGLSRGAEYILAT